MGFSPFDAKAWWTLVCHQLSPTKTDYVLSLDRTILVAGIMEGYDIDVDKIIRRDIRNRYVRTDTTIAFP